MSFSIILREKCSFGVHLKSSGTEICLNQLDGSSRLSCFMNQKSTQISGVGKGTQTSSVRKCTRTSSIGKSTRTSGVGKCTQTSGVGKGTRTSSVGKCTRTSSIGKILSMIINQSDLVLVFNPEFS